MKTVFPVLLVLGLFISSLGLVSCAEVSVPDARNVKIPAPVAAKKRERAVNERPDSVMYLPLGEDVLVPTRVVGDRLPSEQVGPFELRGETLAGALQLILADYDVTIAFETDEGLSRQVTVTNLRGNLDKVVDRVCALSDLYCYYEDGTITVKETQTFTVTLPPLATAGNNAGDGDGGDLDNGFLDDVITGLSAIVGQGVTPPVRDVTTRTIVYSATQRTAKLAENYFQRLRASTAMIVFETYIWEVQLESGNSTGIDWDTIESFGKFGSRIAINGSVGGDFTNPISIGLPTTQAFGANPTDFVEFLSQFGAVKTISQPQITVLSGSRAELRVADTQNFVSEVTSTTNDTTTTTSVTTDTVDSGFTLAVRSSWDKSTVYANIRVELSNVLQIDNFTFSDGDESGGGSDTIIQLPQTTQRELSTQIRVRPGDSVLIAGLVRETDDFDSRGPGFMEPVIPDSRTAETENLELVILLRPRVVVYTAPDDKRYQKYVSQKSGSSKARSEWMKSDVSAMNSSAVAVPPVAAPMPTPPAPEVAPAIPQQPSANYNTGISSAPSSYDGAGSSGYTPGYVSSSSMDYDDAPVSIAPQDNYGSYSSSSSSVDVYGSSNPSYPDNAALSADVYNNAQPQNVYEAYERSKNSYYAP